MRTAYLYKKANILSVVLLLLLNILVYGQSERAAIRKGNKLFNEGNFAEAEKKYSEALNKKNDYLKGQFNLGDAYYKQGKYKEAINLFESIAAKKLGKDTLAMAQHNIGNNYLQNYLGMPKLTPNDSINKLKQELLESSVEAYKKALKNNPSDEDTRYNLSYANRLLQQMQKNQNKDKDKDKDKKDKDKKEDKQKENKDKKDEKKDKKEEPKPDNKISKEDAQRLLDAIDREEKQTQEKLKKEKTKGVKSKTEKDW